VPPGTAGSRAAAPQKSHAGLNCSETKLHVRGSAASMTAILSAPGLPASLVDVRP
jgi:hypothetical protein